MAEQDPTFYSPALRMKAGELAGVRRLAADVSRFVIPRFIVPPRKERDAAEEAVLMQLDITPDAGALLEDSCWGRRVLLDATHLFADFGEEKARKWLPDMFARARARNVSAIPIASVADLGSSRAIAFEAAIDRASGLKLGIAVGEADLYDQVTLRQKLLSALDVLKVKPNECIVIADFKNGAFENPDIASGPIEGAIAALEEVGRWHRVGFQGTSFPLKNPAEASGEELVPRYEWLAWRKAVSFGKSLPHHLMYGDYAADHATMSFKAKGGRPQRHYRYATPDAWYVVRGPDEGAQAAAMTGVCGTIVLSDHFAGRAFSSADEYIFQTARGLAVGSPTTWREINTCHHITRVVRDIGAAKGISFADTKTAQPDTQLQLFPLK